MIYLLKFLSWNFAEKYIKSDWIWKSQTLSDPESSSGDFAQEAKKMLIEDAKKSIKTQNSKRKFSDTHEMEEYAKKFFHDNGGQGKNELLRTIKKWMTEEGLNQGSSRD